MSHRELLYAHFYREDAPQGMSNAALRYAAYGDHQDDVVDFIASERAIGWQGGRGRPCHHDLDDQFDVCVLEENDDGFL